MKKEVIILLSIILFGTVITGCASAPVKPEEITYKEISAEEYFKKVDHLEELYSDTDTLGYKVVNVFELRDWPTITFSAYKHDDFYSHPEQSVNAEDFLQRISQSQPDFPERLSNVIGNTKYNGHLTVYLYGRKESDNTTPVFVYNIEGVPTKAQLEADKAEEERVKAEEAAAEAKAKAEEENKLNEQGKTLSKGYIYHGIDEVSSNQKLFINGALEEGHAYYVSGFVVKYGGSMATIQHGDGLFFSSEDSPVYVQYASQKLKGQIIETGIVNLFGTEIEKPLIVVITAGKNSLQTPIVLGIIKKEDK